MPRTRRRPAVELSRSRDQRAHCDDPLFPIQHGILYYPGIEVLPPFVQYGTDRMTDESYPDVAKA
jgi:putative NADPH-quinone reductase